MVKITLYGGAATIGGNMRSFWKDIYFGIRLLGKNPGFTAVAVFSLAVGIGLNATIFCIVDRLILRPLPVQNPDELVLITIQGEKGGSTTSLPYPEYLDLRNQCSTLSGIIGTQRHMAILSSGEMPELLPSEYVTRNYFSVLGVKAHLGRVFRDGDADLADPQGLYHNLRPLPLVQDDLLAGIDLLLVFLYFFAHLRNHLPGPLQAGAIGQAAP